MRLLLLLFAIGSTTAAQIEDNITGIISEIFTLVPPVPGLQSGGESAPDFTPNINKDNITGILTEIFTLPPPVPGLQSAGEPAPDFTPNKNPDPVVPIFQPKPFDAVDDTDSCECVPFYLCENGTINEGGIIEIRIRDGPCPDYLSECCEKGNIVTHSIAPKHDVNKAKACGVRNPAGIGFRIKGDTNNEAQFGEFPWMVAISIREGVEGNSQKALVYQCGASLIHPQVVLTAAHCVSEKEKKYQIRAGEWDTQTELELYPHQDRHVQTIILHPEFYSRALYNDIALLILDSPLEIGQNVETICLPPQGEIVDYANCFASGWGKDDFGKKGKYQVILKKVQLPIVPRGICQTNLSHTRLGERFLLHDSFICAGGEAGIDTCKGDGGGPLVCPIPGLMGKYYQAGIVSWGISCGDANVPGVYANVPLFTDWINDQLLLNNLVI